jgi:glycosyltransferase involved in cell wall biosynthesis
VIPTCDRPNLLVRAVESARAQTFDAIEIVVVLDGDQPESAAALARIADPRMKIVALPRRVGRGPATNAGVDAAQAGWIALLDDDDEWMPEKLRVQWQAAQTCDAERPIVACHFIARAETGDQIWPRRRPRPGESLGDYLMVQHGLRGGEGMLLPSTLLIRRELLIEERFATLRQFIDLDWLLRVERRPGVAVAYVPTGTPLAVWHMAGQRTQISASRDWQSAVAFVQARREVFSPCAQVAFLLTQASMAAARDHHWRVFVRLIREAYRLGHPRPVDLSAHLAIWLAARDTRIRIVTAIDRWWSQGRRLLRLRPAREQRTVA